MILCDVVKKMIDVNRQPSLVADSGEIYFFLSDGE